MKNNCFARCFLKSGQLSAVTLNTASSSFAAGTNSGEKYPLLLLVLDSPEPRPPGHSGAGASPWQKYRASGKEGRKLLTSILSLTQGYYGSMQKAGVLCCPGRWTGLPFGGTLDALADCHNSVVLCRDLSMFQLQIMIMTIIIIIYLVLQG